MKLSRTCIVLAGISLIGAVGCGGGSENGASSGGTTEVSAKQDFCTVAKGQTKADLALKQGDADSVKLYYANQVGMSSSLVFAAPADILEIAKNLQNGTVELYKILESFKFSFTKMTASESALAKIKAISDKYHLEDSDQQMSKYLLDKCGISPQQQGVPTTVAQ